MGFGPNSASRGSRTPSRAGSGLGGAGPWAAGQATPSACVPRRVLSPGGGGKRPGRGLDVDDRTARGGKCPIKLQLGPPARLAPRCLWRVCGVRGGPPTYFRRTPVLGYP